MNTNELSIDEYFDESLWEMSNYSSSDTGLPPNTTLWVRTEPLALSRAQYTIKLHHKSNGTAVFSIFGDDAQQVAGDWKVSGFELEKIQRLIKLSNEAIRTHIDGEISSLDLGVVLHSNADEVKKHA